MGGLCEERFGEIGRGGERRMRVRAGEVETGGRDGSEIGSVMEEENKSRGPVSMPASPRTSGIKRRATCGCCFLKYHSFWWEQLTNKSNTFWDM